MSEIPDDPQYDNQGHLAIIEAAAAWDISHGDSIILIGIVDTGMDMDHPDLEVNYFVNEVEFNGEEGIDDDGNGYVNDISGWDFAGPSSAAGPQPDNDPTHGPGVIHGTHVAGLANAVTNNETGVAGVAWNVRTLPVKVSYDDLGDLVNFGYSGIVYAAEMGADVINASWGGSGFSEFERDVIEYITGLGALLVTSAGNSNSDAFLYPAAYEKVFAVAATGSNDVRASFSSFGILIDVAAPGESILSTLPDGEYGALSGTSMSSPITAGLAALVKSFYPDLTNKEIALRVAGTTDNIDNLNQNYAGLLGSGRINASQALTYDDAQFVSIPPAVRFLGSGITDSVAGNGDGVLDVGEQVHFSVTSRNYSLGGADSYYVTLTTEDPDLTIINGISVTYSFPSDTIHTIENEMNFSISGSAEPHMAKVALTLFVDGEMQDTDTLSIIVGKMPILIVKDDNESCCGDTEASGFYTGILDEEGLICGVWDHASLRSPGPAALKSFPIVIWFTEWDFPSLDSLDIVALKEYLDSGGNLYISGQDLGWDINENPGFSFHQNFYADYLHAQWGGDHAGTMEVIGINNDPIGDKLSFPVYQPGIGGSSQYPDWFTPDGTAHLVFQYDNGLGMGLRYEGDYRLVYTGVGLEAFGSDNNSVPPEDINDVQRTALKRILTYLNFIQHEPLTDTEVIDIDYEITIHVSGDSTDLESVTLYFKTELMDDFVGSLMAGSGGGDYTGTIPAVGVSSGIDYYIETVHSYYSWASPVGAPQNVYSFYAGADTVSPVIEFVTELEDQFGTTNSVEIAAEVVDNIGVGNVVLEYSISSDTGSAVITVPMSFDGVDVWTGEISWADVQWYTTITFSVIATDSSSQQNMAESDPNFFTITKELAVGNWEAEDVSGWDIGDGWGFVNVGGHGRVMNDSPEGFYENNANNVLSLIEPMNISYYESAYLLFWHKSVLEADKDFGLVELSTDGIEWTIVSSITGIRVEREEVIDLTPYIAESGLWLRFRMTSDENKTYVGWFLDDLYLMVDTTLIISTEEYLDIIPEGYSLEQNYPNPFNPVTTVRFGLPEAGNLELVIYDILGREVAELVSGRVVSGTHEVVWNASDMASGVYFYRLVVRQDGILSYADTKKLIVLK
ncbi:MAG: S8 family serine peptidase [Candidatus Marinimicrobia bacterium]|nr:S8 family serine peptidase [Candidatus Neomarinimicrobiota bacterium]